MIRLAAAFPSAAAFLAAFDQQIAVGGLFIAGAQAPGASALADCIVAVTVDGVLAGEIAARIAAVSGGGVAVLFDQLPPLLATLAEELRGAPAAFAAPEAELRGTVAARLAALPLAQKMQVAMTGGREERMALLRDVTQALHLFVVRNPRIALDEIQFAARTATVSPEALKFISEHAEWGQNPVVCTALIRNPRLPQSIALRLLDRIPVGDLRAIAKGAARQPIVNAARKKLGL